MKGKIRNKLYYYKSKNLLFPHKVKSLTIVTKSSFFPSSNSTLNYEQAKSHLDSWYENNIFTIPVRLLGVSVEETTFEGVWTVYANQRYSREVFSKNTEKFGFYDKDNDFFISKKNINIKNHEVILGAFYFKSKDIFFNAYNEMISQNDLINGEYYLDTIGNYINNSKNFYIKDFFSIGTPEELEDNIKKI